MWRALSSSEDEVVMGCGVACGQVTITGWNGPAFVSTFVMSGGDGDPQDEYSMSGGDCHMQTSRDFVWMSGVPVRRG
jgi:hypothetical protein